MQLSSDSASPDEKEKRDSAKVSPGESLSECIMGRA